MSGGRSRQAPPGFSLVAPDWLRGERVRLRAWREDDLPTFAALNADTRAMVHFPAPLDREASDALARRCQSLIDRQGWGFWAVECGSGSGAEGAFIGMVGLHSPVAELPFSPCVEIGWRLLPAWWGQGLAHEAAQLALRVGFEALNLAEIVAFTTAGNHPSQALMARLGMACNPADDFVHPSLPAGHALRPHVLYRLPYAAWRARQGAAPPP